MNESIGDPSNTTKDLQEITAQGIAQFIIDEEIGNLTELQRLIAITASLHDRLVKVEAILFSEPCTCRWCEDKRREE